MLDASSFLTKFVATQSFLSSSSSLKDQRSFLTLVNYTLLSAQRIANRRSTFLLHLIMINNFTGLPLLKRIARPMSIKSIKSGPNANTTYTLVFVSLAINSIHASTDHKVKEFCRKRFMSTNFTRPSYVYANNF